MTIGSILQERTSSNMLSLNYLSISRILFLYPKEGKIFGVLFFSFVDEVLCGDDLLYVNVFEGWQRVLAVGMNLKNMGGAGSLTLL